jgi:hypothetical protein
MGADGSGLGTGHSATRHLWDVIDGGGEEIGGFEDFKVALGFPTAPGAVR